VFVPISNRIPDVPHFASHPDPGTALDTVSWLVGRRLSWRMGSRSLQSSASEISSSRARRREERFVDSLPKSAVPQDDCCCGVFMSVVWLILRIDTVLQFEQSER
jgi:hypothetical protein